MSASRGTDTDIPSLAFKALPKARLKKGSKKTVLNNPDRNRHMGLSTSETERGALNDFFLLPSPGFKKSSRCPTKCLGRSLVVFKYR